MTIYAMPDPPPADVTTLWDADGDEWCRLEDDRQLDELFQRLRAANEHPAASEWVPRDTLDDEPSITANVVDWLELVYAYGPLSDTAPKETP